MSVAGPVQGGNDAGVQASAYQLPRRRISYLIPPPPEDQPPPLLALPAPHEVKQAKRGNPNPLIILASELDARQKPRSGYAHEHQFAASPSSSRSGTGAVYNGASPLRNGKQQGKAAQRHPEHTLGVSALALDLSTVIDSSHNGSKRPAGILYSGGRDALVASWELSLSLKQKDTDAQSDRYPQSEQQRRRYRPRWAEDPYDSSSSSDEDNDDDGACSDSSREGSSAENQPMNHQTYGGSPRLRLDTTFADSPVGKPSSRTSNGLHLNLSQSPRSNGLLGRKGKKSRSKDTTLPYEERWSIDSTAIATEPPPKASFRQAHRAHTDWVNDIVLCNLNQTVISASSDRMIRAWNPHDPHASMLPATLGSHNDYVKCLAHSREHRWIASGGFDRQIKVWDVMESRPDPIVDITFDASVYSLATNAAGSLIACGSPEKVVRIYDPRQATNSVARLVGHADNVRSIVVSSDGRHILSASSDATVKLWSVAMQRCLHTFTFHSDSVWSLASSHPDLEVFYSGDRTGTVCKTDFSDCGDIASEGECVVLLRNRDDSKPGSYPSANDGINRIVATGDAYLWTASSSSDICRWKDTPSRSERRRTERLAVRQPSAKYGADAAAQPILSSSFGSSDMAAPRREPLKDASPAQLSQASERSVAFAPDLVNLQRAPSNQPGSAMQQRLSSFRKTSSRNFSNSTVIDQYGTQATTSPKQLGEAFQPTAIEADVPSLNGFPLESLVPLFTPDDPYARPSAYGLRPDGTGGVGYSASVLSLHRTNSRPLTSSSPFGGVLSSSPPTSGLAARAAKSPHMFGRNSPRPVGMMGDPRARSIMEEDEEGTVDSHSQQPRNEAYLLAFQEYEDRETALDAVPMRNDPDDVIRGRHGLIRAMLLNDRRTVISLDTLGEVAVWDIVLGGCIGHFSSIELRHRLRLDQSSTSDSEHADDADDFSKADVLEYVRTQIEGEAVVNPWCSVESRTGLLTVHIDQNRAFEAEVYLDEAGVEPRPDFKADQRLNLGKWVLRNLLDGFITEEVKVQNRRRSLSTTSSSSMSSLSSEEVITYSKARRPSHVSITNGFSAPSDTQSEASWSSHFGMTPAGFNIALATPAMTPAVLPSASDLHAQFASPRLLPASLPQAQPALPTIPQSPHANGSAPVTPLSTGAQADYFSRPRTSTAPETPGVGAQTPRAGSSLPPLPTLPSSVGGKASKMSRFKSFGRKDAKKDQVEPSTPAPVEEALSTIPAAAADTHLPPAERAQRQLIKAALSRPIHPSPFNETPPIRFAGDLVMMIGEEAQDAGAWATVYRGAMSRCASSLKELEAVLPQWLLDCSLHNTIHVREPIKIAFVLEPWGGPDKAGLPELPSGNARLSATRMLRMRKACHYVAEKLELESWKQRQQYLAALDAQSATGSKAIDLSRSHTRSSLSSSSYGHIPGLAHPEGPDPPSLLPEDELEILCNDQLVPLNITLAACARYSYGKSGDIPLTYRRRAIVNTM